uniref:Uncharacterized protein n=1 Tax=Chryseobacterium endophyticum TaxID=1854762 RepID=A0AAU6WMC0_9FLAO
MLWILPCKAQNFIQKYQDRVNQLSKDNITANLKAFEKLGVKTTGSVENDSALQWIRKQYLSYGYTENQMMEDPFSIGRLKSKNLIITKKERSTRISTLLSAGILTASMVQVSTTTEAEHRLSLKPQEF